MFWNVFVKLKNRSSAYFPDRTTPGWFRHSRSRVSARRCDSRVWPFSPRYLHSLMQNDSVRFCVIAFNVSIEDDGEVKLMVCEAYL